MIKLKTLLIEKRLPRIARITHEVKVKLAALAQSQYDAWEQGEDGYDEELGTGGICHLIAEDLADALSAAGIECFQVSSDEPHVYLVGRFREGVYMIDIPYYVYESGSGFNWKKKKNVKFDASHVEITKLNNDPQKFYLYIDNYD